MAIFRRFSFFFWCSLILSRTSRHTLQKTDRRQTVHEVPTYDDSETHHSLPSRSSDRHCARIFSDSYHQINSEPFRVFSQAARKTSRLENHSQHGTRSILHHYFACPTALVPARRCEATFFQTVLRRKQYPFLCLYSFISDPNWNHSSRCRGKAEKDFSAIFRSCHACR